MRKLHKILLNRQDAVSGRLMVNILEKAAPDELIHGIAVAEISALIAQHAGVDASRQGDIWLGGFLHDIGKLGVPGEILTKKGPLTKHEKRYVDKHPVIGKYIVDRFFDPGRVGEAILFHHERIDGSGYPRGLKHDDIPLQARIIAIADIYDAARSSGWLFRKKSHETVVDELKELAGKTLDEHLTRVAIKHAAGIRLAYEAVRAVDPKKIRSLF